jgi:isoleucyl-tRNA synthetase
MRRIEDVLDCWFDSGSMPFAQVHYPFENREWFEHHYPGDFIVEYISQTRGWFYTLHVLATALFDRPAFRTCVAHGIVLGSDAQKMSKSLRNYPDPYEMFDSYGSDAMRWFLLSSSILRGSDLAVTEPAIRDAVRQVVNPLWNTWYFFTLYANSAGEAGYRARFRADQVQVLDRYVLAKLHDLVTQTTTAMDAYDFFAACGAIRSFLDTLTNWYIRRSRDRFWVGDADAFDTRFTAVHVLCRVAAPLMPLVTEEVFTGLTDARSVHLADWPLASEIPADAALVRAMDRVRDVCSVALSIRKANGLRVRLPLASLTVAVPDAESLAPFVSLIADEVNVKEVRLTSDVGAVATSDLALVPAVLGPRLGAQTQKVIHAAKGGDWERADDGAVSAGGVVLEEGEYTVRLVPIDNAASACLPGSVGVVVVDLDVTPELTREGLARDLVRAIQQARRDAQLHVSDRVTLTLDGLPADLVSAVETHRDVIARETLATGITVTEAGLTPNAEVDGRRIHVGLVKE